MNQTAIITGANRGIGLEITKILASKNYQVIALCRQSSEELNQLDVEVIENIDVTNSKGIESAKNKIKDQKIDLLINNAGVWSDESLGELDEKGINSIKKTFKVNTYGPIRITHHFLDLMNEDSKIALITSRMGSIEDNTSGGRYGYRMSKAALNMFGKSLSFDLKDKKIAVAILHPGYVQTRMTDFSGNISPKEAASGLVDRIENLNLDNTGSFWHSNGEELPW
jgi:NAD(P)-dependent dehydrogenase (short-subunit alcohol dehydrogenase family)